jgi:Bacterial PH domain/GYF domain 2
MDILVHKDGQEHGPYTEEHLLALLQQGSISKRDLIFYEGMAEWQPLEEIFEVEEALRYDLHDGQDPTVIVDVYQQVNGIISSHEEILYVAHQKPKMLKHKPDAVVLTNERVIIMRQGLGGSRIEDYQLRDILSTQMKEGIMGTTFTLLDRNNHVIQVDDLPKPQLERLLQLRQEMAVSAAAA